MRYCPICGAINPPEAERCVSCRRVLPDSEQPPAAGAPAPPVAPAGSVSWADPFSGVPGATAQPGSDQPSYGQTGYGDYDHGAYGSAQADNASYQQTAPYGAPYGSYDPYGSPASASDTYQYGTPPQTQSYPYDPPSDPSPPAASPRQPLPPPVRRESGPAGCIMGCLAVLIIAALAAAFVGLGIVRPLLKDEIGDEIERVVATQVAQQLAPGDGTPEFTAGTYVISADEINDDLRRNSDAYEPLDSPEITIDPDGLELSFEAFGQESSYRGGVAVENGRIVLTDVEASGLAERVLPANDVQEILEGEFNGYILDAGLIVEEAQLSDGELILTTASAVPTPATPAATPAASPVARVTPRVITPARSATTTPTPRPTEEPADEDDPTAEPTARPRASIPRPSPTPTPEDEPDGEAAGDGPAGDGTGL